VVKLFIAIQFVKCIQNDIKDDVMYDMK